MKLPDGLIGLPQDKSKLAHAYLVTGVDQTLALEHVVQLSRAILCQDNQGRFPLPCEHCKSCQLDLAQNHADKLIISKDGDSIGIDEIRQLTEFLSKTPLISNAQVVIIADAEAMTDNASNALLKTLEEPVGNSYLFLLAKSANILLPTILSRCQQLLFKPKDKPRLLEAYSDIPKYMVGFSQGAESKIRQWQEDGKIANFEQTYQSFLNWLKGQQACLELINTVLADKTLHNFLLYLIERRIRQLALKQHTAAVSAMVEFQGYNQTLRQVRGQNPKLALTSFLQRIGSLIR